MGRWAQTQKKRAHGRSGLPNDRSLHGPGLSERWGCQPSKPLFSVAQVIPMDWPSFTQTHIPASFSKYSNRQNVPLNWMGPVWSDWGSEPEPIKFTLLMQLFSFQQTTWSCIKQLIALLQEKGLLNRVLKPQWSDRETYTHQLLQHKEQQSIHVIPLFQTI